MASTLILFGSMPQRLVTRSHIATQEQMKNLVLRLSTHRFSRNRRSASSADRTTANSTGITCKAWFKEVSNAHLVYITAGSVSS